MERQGLHFLPDFGFAAGTVVGAAAVVVSGVAVGSGRARAAASEGDFGGGFGVLQDGAFVGLEPGQGGEEEAEFSGGGDGLAVLVGVGVGAGEDVDLVGEAVGGDGAEDVGLVELEVAEVGVDGGAGAVEALGDLVGGMSLAVEVVGFEDASAASGGGWVGHGVVRSLRGTYVLLMVCGLESGWGRMRAKRGRWGCWWRSRAGPRVKRGASEWGWWFCGGRD